MVSELSRLRENGCVATVFLLTRQFSPSKSLIARTVADRAIGGRLVISPSSMEGLGPGFVANHFDVMPVRTNDESCIVVRVVVRA